MTKIIVNGEPHEYQHEDIGYSEIAEIAEPGGKRLLSVVYHWRGDGDSERRGTLYPGPKDQERKTIKVADGMKFDAVHTGSA
jgi:hypothetical protein